jgi:hypothetical protein
MAIAVGLRRARSSCRARRDPRFVEEVRDVVGRYRNAPAQSPLFCVDEKPQIEGFARTQPVQPSQVERRRTTSRATGPEPCRAHDAAANVTASTDKNVPFR